MMHFFFLPLIPVIVSSMALVTISMTQITGMGSYAKVATYAKAENIQFSQVKFKESYEGVTCKINPSNLHESGHCSLNK